MGAGIGHLAETVRAVSVEAPLAKLLQAMRRDPDLDLVLISKARKPFALLSRERVMDFVLSARRATLEGLEVGDVVGSPALKVPVEQTALEIFARPGRPPLERFQPGFIVVQNGRYRGIVRYQRLVEAALAEAAFAQTSQPEKADVENLADDEASPKQDASPTPSQGPTDQSDTEQKAQSALPDLLATLAHEVRTPLTGMMGLAEMLSSRVKDAGNRDMADTIVRSGRTLDRILSDTLDFASLDAGKLSLDPRPANLEDLVSDVRALWACEAARKGLALHVSFRPDGPALVKADLPRVQQIVNNLVSNALKFTQEGSVSVLVSTQALENGLTLSVEVADTGSGLAETAKEQIFNAFERAPTAKKIPGWGLGLTISHALARHMQGRLCVADNPGGGSVFTLLLPVEQTIMARPSPESSSTTNAARVRSGRFELGHLLLVEDHEACALVVMDALKAAGWGVSLASTLYQAEKMALNVAYQAIVTDLHLPDGNGLGFIDRVRRVAGPNTTAPIIALTADASKATRQACLAVGADTVARKPVRGPELVASLSDLVLARGVGTFSTAQLRGRLVA
ncbi:MAG: ATP-binding protein [Pseudomonadota bacterium]